MFIQEDVLHLLWDTNIGTSAEILLRCNGVLLQLGICCTYIDYVWAAEIGINILVDFLIKR